MTQGTGEAPLTRHVEKCYILADEYMTEEVIQNLLSNAINYSLKGGKVSVEIKLIGDFIIISVIDTGIGIPDDELPNIFNKLYRGRRSKELSPDGRGIGLTVSKMLIKIQGGMISCKSEEGKGTCFTVQLPVFKIN
jgi:signal transduction histidine kinase